MPHAGVSMSRGQVHQDPIGPEPAEERFDERPYTGPLPVRAEVVDGDLDLTQRAVAASPRPTRSAPRPAAPRSAASRATRSAPRSIPPSDDRESLRNARAAIASWEQAGRVPVDSWDVPSRTRRPSAHESRPEPAAAAATEPRPSGAARTSAQANRPDPAAGVPGPIRAPRPAPLPRSAVTAAAASSGHAGGGVPGRRTVQIQGRGTERYNAGFERRRPPRRPHERDGFRPDRAAMWAVLLGFVLVLVAATSSHAAVLAHHIH